jgi:hypothetical protein
LFRHDLWNPVGASLPMSNLPASTTQSYRRSPILQNPTTWHIPDLSPSSLMVLETWSTPFPYSNSYSFLPPEHLHFLSEFSFSQKLKEMSLTNTSFWQMPLRQGNRKWGYFLGMEGGKRNNKI